MPDRLPPASPHPEPAPALDAGERRIVDSVETYLERGRELRAWWQRAIERDEFGDKFPLSFTYNRPDYSFGFFDRTAVEGRELPIMGNYQTMFYDQPKGPARERRVDSDWMRSQVREFVLRYFMRVSDFRQPQPYRPQEHHDPLPLLAPFSLCPKDEEEIVGFGYSQLFYKLAADGRIGRFPEAERNAIVDLRRIGPFYEWIVLKVDIFDFSFTVAPLGGAGPSFSLPLTEASYLVLNRDFVLDEERPGRGELGHYGLGYAFVKNPQPGLFGFGPGEFDAAVQLIDFHVRDDGRVRVDAAFVSNRPTRVLALSPNPFRWAQVATNLFTGGRGSAWLAPLVSFVDGLPGGDLRFDPVPPSLATANVLTAGYAARELCISMREVEKIFLMRHFLQHFQTLAGSLQTWRQIADWEDERRLPAWVIDGRSA